MLIEFDGHLKPAFVLFLSSIIQSNTTSAHGRQSQNIELSQHSNNLTIVLNKNLNYCWTAS